MRLRCPFDYRDASSSLNEPRIPNGFTETHCVFEARVDAHVFSSGRHQQMSKQIRVFPGTDEPRFVMRRLAAGGPNGNCVYIARGIVYEPIIQCAFYIGSNASIDRQCNNVALGARTLRECIIGLSK